MQQVHSSGYWLWLQVTGLQIFNLWKHSTYVPLTNLLQSQINPSTLSSSTILAHDGLHLVLLPWREGGVACLAPRHLSPHRVNKLHYRSPKSTDNSCYSLTTEVDLSRFNLRPVAATGSGKLLRVITALPVWILIV